MFGNTALSFEDNIDLESVVINQENFDLNKIRLCVSEEEYFKSDYFTKSLPFPKIEEENGL